MGVCGQGNFIVITDSNYSLLGLQQDPELEEELNCSGMTKDPRNLGYLCERESATFRGDGVRAFGWKVHG